MTSRFTHSIKKANRAIATTGATRDTRSVDHTELKPTDLNQRKSVQKVAKPRKVSSNTARTAMTIVKPRLLVRGRNAVGSRLIISSFYGVGTD